MYVCVGQEKYRSLAPMYYRGASAAVIVYDITRRVLPPLSLYSQHSLFLSLSFFMPSQESYDCLQSWVVELRNQGPEDIKMVICGNKKDLESERVRPPPNSLSLLSHFSLTSLSFSLASGHGRGLQVRGAYRRPLLRDERQGGHLCGADVRRDGQLAALHALGTLRHQHRRHDELHPELRATGGRQLLGLLLSDKRRRKEEQRCRKKEEKETTTL